MPLYPRRLVVTLALALTAIAAGDGGTCCPSDLDGDSVVGPADLATLLGAWGPCNASCQQTTLVGRVTLPDGTPAPHAVLVTDRGGQGTTGASGHFGFSAEVPAGGGTIGIHAVVTVQGVTYVGAKVISVEVEGVSDAGTITVTPGSTCPSAWLPGFGPNQAIDGTINAVAAWDDGSGGGPALYVGGLFTMAGSTPVSNIAKWDGTTWTTLGSGVSSQVYDLVIFDDGSGAGEALYACGSFTFAGGSSAARIARWNGSAWSTLGAGVGGLVRDMQVFDDGSGNGPALYAGGDFTTAGGNPANRVAKWNGQAWSALGSGPGNGSVVSLAVFDDSTWSGPALYAAGGLSIPGGVAKWDGTTWQPLGVGVNGGPINALAVFDDGSGSGPALYAGGAFTTAGGAAANRIARWDNGVWTPLGSGITGNAINSLALFDDGTGNGPVLVAAGDFTSAGGQAANRMASWNGKQWTPIANNLNAQVRRIVPWDLGLGGGSVLCVVGDFTDGPSGDPRLARFGCDPAGDRRR